MCCSINSCGASSSIGCNDDAKTRFVCPEWPIYMFIGSSSIIAAKIAVASAVALSFASSDSLPDFLAAIPGVSCLVVIIVLQDDDVRVGITTSVTVPSESGRSSTSSSLATVTATRLRPKHVKHRAARTTRCS